MTYFHWRRALGFALLLLAVTPSAWASSSKEFTGSAAPDFTIEEWRNGTGESRLSDFRGRVVLLEFWATW